MSDKTRCAVDLVERLAKRTRTINSGRVKPMTEKWGWAVRGALGLHPDDEYFGITLTLQGGLTVNAAGQRDDTAATAPAGRHGPRPIFTAEGVLVQVTAVHIARRRAPASTLLRWNDLDGWTYRIEWRRPATDEQVIEAKGWAALVTGEDEEASPARWRPRGLEDLTDAEFERFSEEVLDLKDRQRMSDKAIGKRIGPELGSPEAIAASTVNGWIRRMRADRAARERLGRRDETSRR